MRISVGRNYYSAPAERLQGNNATVQSRKPGARVRTCNDHACLETQCFGVRHLSPTGAWHLRRLLDAVRPKAVLIEGLSDADSLIADMTRKATKPPMAILA